MTNEVGRRRKRLEMGGNDAGDILLCNGCFENRRVVVAENRHSFVDRFCSAYERAQMLLGEAFR